MARVAVSSHWQVGKRISEQNWNGIGDQRSHILRASPTGRFILVSEYVRFGLFRSVHEHENTGRPFASTGVPSGHPGPISSFDLVAVTSLDLVAATIGGKPELWRAAPELGRRAGLVPLGRGTGQEDADGASSGGRSSSGGVGSGERSSSAGGDGRTSSGGSTHSWAGREEELRRVRQRLEEELRRGARTAGNGGSKSETEMGDSRTDCPFG
jgi:hypothetical protein